MLQKYGACTRHGVNYETVVGVPHYGANGAAQIELGRDSGTGKQMCCF
jgi:hypothetical protein